MSSQSKLRLGWISYLNLHPLFSEIKNDLEGHFELSLGTPSEVNEKMRQGKVDLAPSSSICLLFDKPKDYIPLGVVSKGPVLSVYLGFKEEHKPFFQRFEQRLFDFKNFLSSSDSSKTDAYSEKFLSFSSCFPFVGEIPPLTLTGESQTSAELTKIFLHSLFGANSLSNLNDGSQDPVELLIGDQALKRREEFEDFIDLGEIWSDITQLPFVFAVFQSNLQMDPGLKERLMSLALLAETKMHQDSRVYSESCKDEFPHLTKEFLSQYWKSLYYRIDDNSEKGLNLFLELARQRAKGRHKSVHFAPRST